MEKKEELKKLTMSDKAILQVASNLKSSRFVLALIIVIPIMVFFGYTLVSVDVSDKLSVLQMANSILLMVLAVYFQQQAQQNKSGDNKNE